MLSYVYVRRVRDCSLLSFTPVVTFDSQVAQIKVKPMEVLCSCCAFHAFPQWPDTRLINVSKRSNKRRSLQKGSVKPDSNCWFMLLLAVVVGLAACPLLVCQLPATWRWTGSWICFLWDMQVLFHCTEILVSNNLHKQETFFFL